MASLAGRWPGQMALATGYYVLNPDTMDLITGPFDDSPSALTALQAAQAVTAATRFVIVWVPDNSYVWGL